MGETVGKIAKWALIATAIVISIIALQPGLTLTWIGQLVVTAGFTLLAQELQSDPQLGTSDQKGLKVELRSTVSPRQVVYGRARIAGTQIYLGTHGVDNKYMTMINVVCADEIDSFEKWFLNELEVNLDGSGFVTAGQYAGKVRILSHTGSATQAADATLVSEIGEWSTAHKLQGLAYYSIRYEYDVDVFTGGRPVPNAVVKGVPLYNPILDSTVPGGSGAHRDDDPSTWEWTNNWALGMLDYLKRDPLCARIPIEWINMADIITAYNESDEDVTLDGGGTQKRYTLDGVASSARKRNIVIDEMLRAAAGRLVYQSGEYHLYAGAAGVAIVDLDEDDLRGPIAVQTKKPIKDQVNTASGTFMDNQDDLYAETDYPAYVDTVALAADGYSLEVPLGQPFIQDGIRAQRLAKIFVKEARQQLTVTFPSKLKALQLQAWSVVKVTNSRWGWVEKLFRVNSWQRQGNSGIDLSLSEYDANSWTWIPGTDELPVPPPVIPTYGDGTEVPPVLALAAVPTALPGDGTESISAFTVSWTAPGLQVSAIELQYKAASATDWIDTPQLARETISVVVPNLLPLTSYNVRVRFINLRGVSGAYAQVNESTDADSDWGGAGGATIDGEAVVFGGTNNLFANGTFKILALDGRPAGVRAISNPRRTI